MSLKLKDIVGNIFYTDKQEKAAEQQKTADLQQKTNTVFGATGNQTYNPFLNKNGELANPYINYQQLLDNPSVSQTAKKYISQATGLSPTPQEKETIQASTGGAYVPPGNAPKTSSGNTIADSAQKYLGTPYVWGGESMEEGGMDCSGFVHNVLKDAGYDIGRTTAQGYRNYGTKVSKEDIQPGDLIFYGNNGNASHIGVYLGNGQIIHSTGGSKNTKNNPGKGVIISNMDHRSDFIEARRY